MKKRIFSILLAVVMLLGMIPGTALTAFAAETPTIITVDGFPAPQAEQSVEDWRNSISAPGTLSGGVTWMGEEQMFWIEGEYDNVEAAVAALDTNGPFVGKFEDGEKYTFYAGLVPDGGELPAEATVTAAGTNSATYELWTDPESGDTTGLIFLTYTVGEGTPTPPPAPTTDIVLENHPLPGAGTTVEAYWNAMENAINDDVITVNGETYYNGNFGDIPYEAWYLYDSEMQQVDDGVFATGTYYVLWDFVYTYDEDITATVNGKSVYVQDLGTDKVRLRIELSVPASGTATIVPYETVAGAYYLDVKYGTSNPAGNWHAEGTEITLTADAPEKGMAFDKWILTGVTVADVTASMITFNMPAGEVAATATYKAVPVTGMTLDKDYIILNTTNDTGVSSKKSEEVDVTIVPNNANSDITVTYDDVKMNVFNGPPVNGVSTLGVYTKSHPGVFTVTITSVANNEISKTLTVYIQEDTPVITIEDGNLVGFSQGASYKICADGVEDYTHNAPVGAGTQLTIKPEWIGKTLSIYKVSDDHANCYSDACVVEVSNASITYDVSLSGEHCTLVPVGSSSPVN